MVLYAGDSFKCWTFMPLWSSTKRMQRRNIFGRWVVPKKLLNYFISMSPQYLLNIVSRSVKPTLYKSQESSIAKKEKTNVFAFQCIQLNDHKLFDISPCNFISKSSLGSPLVHEKWNLFQIPKLPVCWVFTKRNYLADTHVAPQHNTLPNLNFTLLSRCWLPCG